jgi:DNA integrity scanning protein DisA with diadenylate cyclase activity
MYMYENIYNTSSDGPRVINMVPLLHFRDIQRLVQKFRLLTTLSNSSMDDASGRKGKQDNTVQHRLFGRCGKLKRCC